MPPNYVCRQNLLDEIVSKLFHCTIYPDGYGTSVTVTGAGGFGKTSIVTSLCHHPLIKEKFTDGVVFIELGPQVTDPSMKLSQLYHLLTGQYLKQGDINHAEQEINQLIGHYCRNLLVIIDDVWHVEDAEPIVKAFSTCKIVLTTRMNDVEQHIPTKNVVTVGPMKQSEAISLLTCGVMEISKLPEEDKSELEEIAQDVHLWPLLLSLIRGHLSHNLKRYHSCYHIAIQSVQAKLRENGLTAFDKNNIERSRKYAVKICIEVTLELLTESLSGKIKSLLLWTGIGTSLQTAVLQNLWNTTEQKARDIVDVLWAYGLVQFTEITMPPHNKRQHCVEVHAVISQYIIECIDSNEVWKLSPSGELGTKVSVCEAIAQQFWRFYGRDDPSSLNTVEFLKFKANQIEHIEIPYHLKQVNVSTVLDPHIALFMLQKILNALEKSPHIKTCLPSVGKEIDVLMSSCYEVLKDVYKMSRKLNQSIQRCVTEKNYNNLIKAIETYNKNYPMAEIAQKAVTTIKKTFPYCDRRLKVNIAWWCEKLQMMTPDYHDNTLTVIPYMKLYAKELEQIYSSLQKGSPHIENAQNHFLSGQHEEEFQMIMSNYLIKLQEVAPASLRRHVSNRAL